MAKKTKRGCEPVLPMSQAPETPTVFPPGTFVRLRLCPFGEPGLVEGTKYRRVLVRWRNLDYVGRHRAETLVEASREA